VKPSRLWTFNPGLPQTVGLKVAGDKQHRVNRIGDFRGNPLLGGLVHKVWSGTKALV
jgi:hypothetical protein